MIPESEWKFFEGMEQRVKHLSRHRLENELALLSGAELPWNPEELAERQAGLLHELDYPARVQAALEMDPTPDQARHLDLHRRWALGALFDTHPDLRELVIRIPERIGRFRPRIGDREVSHADLRTILAREPDPELRHAAWDALAPLGEAIEEDLRELIRRRELLARAVAGTGFPALALHAAELERSTVVGLLDEFERFTRKAYEGARGEIARILDHHDLEPWDLEFGLRQASPLEFQISAEAASAAAMDRARGWGSPAGSVHHEARDLPRATLVLALDLPGEVLALYRPEPGLNGYRTAFQALGEGLHLAQVETRRHFLEQESPVVRSAAGWLFAGVLEDPRWLKEQTGAPAAAIDEHLRLRRLMTILELRRAAAHTAFENLVYAQSDLEPQRLYSDVMEQMLQETRRPAILWPAAPEFVLHPLGRFSPVIGAMIAAQIEETLRTDPDASGSEAATGTWLRTRLAAPGASEPWEEKVERVTGKILGIDPLARALDVSFEGSTLEETEEISDEAAAEYFKDIDLSDLE